MATTVENSLSGPVGVQPSDATLARTARAGTVTIADPERAAYSAVETVHGLTTVEVTTGHHRAGGTSGQGEATPRLVAALPAAPWSVRLYVRVPSLQAAGHGDEELRWLCWLGSGLGLVAREISGGSIQLRLYGTDLSYGGDGLIGHDGFSGSSIATVELVRLELDYDGADLEVRTYVDHATSPTGTYTFAGVTISGDLQVTGYRFRDGFQYPHAPATFNETVQTYQQRLMDLQYPAPDWGADGYYGDEHEGQLDDFAADYGLPGLVGTFGSGSGAGPEVLAAIDLAHALEYSGDPTPPPLYVSHLAVTDTGTGVGPAPTPGGNAVASLAALTAADTTKQGQGQAAATLALTPTVVAGRGGGAEATLGLVGTATGTKTGRGSAGATLGVTGTATGAKTAYGSAVATMGVAGAAAGTKTAYGQAVATLGVVARADQLVELIPPLAALARVADHPQAEAVPIGRAAATTTRAGRIGGTAGRGY